MKTIAILLLTSLSISIYAQRTVGLVEAGIVNIEGYVLFSPLPSNNAYLINKCGEKVHEWSTGYRPGQSNYLLEDGTMLRAGNVSNPNFTGGGTGGIIEKYSWDGDLLWSYEISDENYCQHHDIRPLPNGNILAIAWDRYTSTDAIAEGRDPADVLDYIWSEKIIELQPIGTNEAEVVWEWKLWDHLVQNFDDALPNFGVVNEHPELMNINFLGSLNATTDWIHLNSIDYNAELDQIMVSAHNLNELWIIDHSTSTAEAATHNGGLQNKGGDLLYRWGNPRVYGRGTVANKKLFGQHHATWIPQGYQNEGKILIFNNGLNRPDGDYSTIEIIESPVDMNGNYPIDVTAAYLPLALFYTYTAAVPTDFYAQLISGVYPLIDGSFFITNGPNGYFFEINSEEETVWKYINPVSSDGIASQGTAVANNSVFRSAFYASDYPAFDGVTLTPLGEIELNPIEQTLCEELLDNVQKQNAKNNLMAYPNPTNSSISLTSAPSGIYEISILNYLGAPLFVAKNQSRIDVGEFCSGIYFLQVKSDSGCQTVRFSIE